MNERVAEIRRRIKRIVDEQVRPTDYPSEMAKAWIAGYDAALAVVLAIVDSADE